MNAHDLQFIADYLKFVSQPLVAMYNDIYEKAGNALKLIGAYICRQG